MWGIVLGLIINARGAGGSGKTTLAQRILKDFRWQEGGLIRSLERAGRERPMGYCLRHPEGGPDLIVLGHYERTSGGCDTIPLSDGGLDEVFRLAELWADAGCDVFLEGLALSFEVRRSAELARRQNLHVIFLSTPAEQSARNLARRRGVPQSGVAHLASSAQLQRASIETACDRLRQGAKVEELDLDQAHARVRQLLGLGHTLNAGGAQPGGLALPSSP
jgi:hypothetical protein